MKNKVTSQKGTGGSVSKQNTNTGSGSRPGGGKFPISSTNPTNEKRIRG